MTDTVHTILDPPMLPLFVEDDAEEAMYRRIRNEFDALIALPGVTAVLNAVPTLTEGQRVRLSCLWVANYGVHRLDQLRIGHRISRENPDQAMRLRQVCDHVWSIAASDPGWAGAHAVADAAYVAVCGDLLSSDEARLFTKPWADVVGVVR